MGGDDAPELLGGWASADFTPEPGVSMAGYGARREPARGIHDRLVCQALALGTRERPFVLLVADLMAVTGGHVAEIRRRIRAQTGAAEVWVTATHTHSGPRLVASGALAAAASVRFLDRAAEAGLCAIDRMAPVTLRQGHGTVAGVGAVRNSGAESAGDALPLDVVALHRPDDQRPAAVLAVFPCHATVLGAENLDMSADLAGAFRAAMSEGMAAPEWSALAQGAAGDISTRRTRRAQTFAEADRLGALLAAAAREVVEGAVSVRAEPLRAGARIVSLPAKTPADVGRLARPAEEGSSREALERDRSSGDAVRARIAETALQGMAAEERASEALANLGLAGEVASVAIGDLCLVSVPGELYLAMGERIRGDAGPGAVVIGYANGYVGYLPPRNAYGTDDYEPHMAFVAPGATEAVACAAAELARAVRPRPAPVPEGAGATTALRAKIQAVMDHALLGQPQAIRAAAAIVFATVRAGGIVHAFGTGHSHLLAEEGYSRAGSVAVVNAVQAGVLMMHEHAIASGAWEKLTGAAAIVMDHADIEPQRDCLIVISNSGRNAAPVEAALWARKRGMPVIAITSMSHTLAVPTLDPPGLKLYEAADVTLDNAGVPGDAALTVRDGVDMAPTSTLAGAAVLHAVLAEAVERCLLEGVEVPVVRSGNLPGARQDNWRRLAEYHGALPAVYGGIRHRARADTERAERGS